MKTTDKAKRLLSDLASTPSTVKRVRVETQAVRDLALSDAYGKAFAVSAASVLGWIRDNYPIAFEERKNIDAMISSLDNANLDQPDTVLGEINGLMKMAGHYTQ